LFFEGTETDQGEYTQKIIESLPLDKLVLTWIQFLTILQDPSECGDISVSEKIRRKRHGDEIDIFIHIGFSSNDTIF
jgi:hypothetical protein